LPRRNGPVTERHRHRTRRPRSRSPDCFQSGTRRSSDGDRDARDLRQELAARIVEERAASLVGKRVEIRSSAFRPCDSVRRHVDDRRLATLDSAAVSCWLEERRLKLHCLPFCLELRTGSAHRLFRRLPPQQSANGSNQMRYLIGALLDYCVGACGSFAHSQGIDETRHQNNCDTGLLLTQPND